jgi:hypothetical protein
MPDRLNRQLLTVAWLLAGAFAASAEEPARKAASSLIAPAEVVLYIHSDLKSTDFVQPLVCALQSVLTAPVSVQALDIPLGPELLATKRNSMSARSPTGSSKRPPGVATSHRSSTFSFHLI